MLRSYAGTHPSRGCVDPAVRGQRWVVRAALLLIALQVSACWRFRPNFPPTGPRGLVRLARRAPPARAGHGVLVIAAEDGPATVYEIAHHRGTVSYEAVLCTRTPCVVRLAHGRHELAFVSPNEQRETHGFVRSSPRPTIALQYEGELRNPAAALVGVPLAILGSLFVVAAAGLSGNPHTEADGTSMLLVGLPVAAGGALLVGWGASPIPAGVAQWDAL